MSQRIAHIALLVRDYDEAIVFFTEKLNFEVVEDRLLDRQKRWVRVAPRGDENFSLLLARAVNPKQEERIGNQTGGRVFLFLQTDDFRRDFDRMTAHGIRFVRPPSRESYGQVAVFEDLYGNLWDLIEPA